MAEDVNLGTRHQAERLPAAQAGGIVVLHLANDDPLSSTELIERFQVAVGESTFRRGNRVAVRVFERLAQVSGERFFEPRRNGVLQGIRLDVDFSPVQSEDAREKKP